MQALWPDLEGIPATHCSTMADVRREIDRTDRALVRLLGQRITYIERAGHIKLTRNTVRDEARIADVLGKVKASCTREGFPFGIAEPVWRALMDGCIAHEFEVFDQMKENTAGAIVAGT